MLINDSNCNLDRFPNVVLIDSNLDEIICTKLAYWKEDFEGRLDSSGNSSLEVSDEEECCIQKHVVEYEDEECLMWGDEIASISLIVGYKNDGTFFLDKRCKVANVFLGKKELNE